MAHSGNGKAVGAAEEERRQRVPVGGCVRDQCTQNKNELSSLFWTELPWGKGTRSAFTLSSSQRLLLSQGHAMT